MAIRENEIVYPEYQSDIDFSEDYGDFEEELSSEELFNSSESEDKENRRSPEARFWYNSNNHFFETNNWKAIYQNVCKLGPLEHSVIWDDVKSLSLVQFAIAMLAYNLLSIRKWNAQEKVLNTQYRTCFLKVADRMIALEPGCEQYYSSKAYFFYNYYLSNHHEDDDYQNAYDLLKDLAQTPAIRFKDAQRFIKLRQKKWEGFKQRDDFKLEELSIEYDTLIDIYSTLNQREQSRCWKNFVSCEYNYVKINTEILWKATLTPYFASLSLWKNEEGWKEWKDINSEENSQRKAIIKKCGAYLKDIIERIPNSDTVESVQNKNKIRFLEIDYRKAQLYDVQGMLCYIVGVPLEKIRYFSEVSELMKKYFEKVDSLMNQRARFNYPWYSKCPYALAEFAVGRFDRASELLLSVPKDIRPFGYYVAARNLLSRMLPFISIDLLFMGKPALLHGIIKYPITDEIREKLKTVGCNSESIISFSARAIYEKKEPIGPSDFLLLLSDIYFQFILKQDYAERQEAIKVLRSAIALFVHYTPEFDRLLTSPEERINAFYYIYVHKGMTPCKKRNNIMQTKVNLMVSAVFEKEMITSLKLQNTEKLENT